MKNCLNDRQYIHLSQTVTSKHLANRWTFSLHEMLNPVCSTRPYSREGEQLLSDGNATNALLALWQRVLSPSGSLFNCQRLAANFSEICRRPKSPGAISVFPFFCSETWIYIHVSPFIKYVSSAPNSWKRRLRNQGKGIFLNGVGEGKPLKIPKEWWMDSVCSWERCYRQLCQDGWEGVRTGGRMPA